MPTKYRRMKTDMDKPEGSKHTMGKNRMEMFSDGVIAIIITIMVLELEVPHEPELAALAPLAPVFLSYVLSFVFVGIYWNNHHHMLHAAHQVRAFDHLHAAYAFPLPTSLAASSRPASGHSLAALSQTSFQTSFQASLQAPLTACSPPQSGLEPCMINLDSKY